jgi:hypothetical protein
MPFRSLFRGSKRPLARQWGSTASYTPIERNYDLEIQEIPIRDRNRAIKLIEIRGHCPEAETAISIITDDVFSSADGDDYGVRVSEEDLNGDRLDAQVYDVAQSCLARVVSLSVAKMAIDRMLSYGDAFGELALDVKPSSAQVGSLQLLPTWDCFRVEDSNGLHFEQRKSLQDSNPIVFAPAEMVHWRFQRNYLYGRSLFHQSIPDWANLKQAILNYARAGNDVGVNANVHQMPEGADAEYLKAYKSDFEDRLKSGVITNFYSLYGGDVKKLGDNPDLSALFEQVEFFRMRIMMRSRLERWKFGNEMRGANDISGQPALAYARFINAIRGDFSEGVKQVLHTELALKRIPEERWKGLLVLNYPKIYVNLHQGEEINLAEDEAFPDTEASQFIPICTVERNGNGNGKLHPIH